MSFDSRLVSQLLTFFSLRKASQEISVVLISPNNTWFFQFLDRRMIKGVYRAWQRATLRYNGAPSDTESICITEINEMLRSLKYLKDTDDKFVFDAINLAERLLRLARWGLQNPTLNSFFRVTFPRSHYRLSLLEAATAFENKLEDENDMDILRRALRDPGGLASVKGAIPRPNAHLLQNQSCFFFIHSHGTLIIRKRTQQHPNSITQKDLLTLLEADDYTISPALLHVAYSRW
jgi:hypothetical protein